jgi:hypothetical protein
MRHGRKLLVCFLGCLVSASNVGAISADNPFQSIVDRNVFGLKPPPPPPAPPEPPKPPLPPIALTGIMTGIGKKRALLEVIMPAKPPDQPKKTFPTLGEGDQEGEIKVIKIDEKANMVELTLMGVLTNLTFSAKAPTAAPPPATAGQPVPGIPSPINTGFNPAAANPAVMQQRSLPGRPLRSNNPAQGGTGTPQGGAAYGQPQANAESQTQNAPQLTRDESALIIEAERERLRQSGDPLANLMPVTHLTPSGAPGTEVLNPNGQQDASTTPSYTPTTRRSRYNQQPQ